MYIFNSCIKDKTPVIYESFVLTRDKQEKWSQSTLSPILNSEGEVTKLVLIDSDITKLDLGDLKRQGDLLRQSASREAERIIADAHRRREEIVAGAADQQVMVAAAVEQIVQSAAVERIVAEPAAQIIVAGAAAQLADGVARDIPVEADAWRPQDVAAREIACIDAEGIFGERVVLG